MVTIHIPTDGKVKQFSLGRRGENNATQIIFDLSTLITDYGDGTAILLAKRSQDSSPYPVATWVQSEDTLTWTVDLTDTSYMGWGKVELFWYVNDTLAKTLVWKSFVEPDIGVNIGLTPDPYQIWVDELMALGAEILENIDTAVDAKDDAITARNQAEGFANDASGYASDALASKNAASGFATDAENAKVTAVNKAGEAADSATSASGSATSANTNALKAEGYAVGKQNGTAVSSGTYYHNNAKYYADQASSSASSAAESATEASTILSGTIIIGQDGNFYIND